MRVVQAVRFGGPEVLVLGELSDPVAAAGQVVIQVAVAGISFVETQIRRGTDRWHARPSLPYVPGGVVAGVVSSVGAQVDPGWIGRRVIADLGEGGGFAEQSVAQVEALFAVPDGLGLAEALALHGDGSTAQGLVENAEIGPDDRVLIEAAGGGVGSLVVQLARAAGAQVIGAARGARKLELIRELGADVAVDYSDPGWTEWVLDATGGAGPTVVFDGIGGQIGRAAFEMTAYAGRFSIHGASSGDLTQIDPMEANAKGIKVIGVEQLFDFAPNQVRWAEQMMAKAAAGILRPIIGQTFPLERAADAHAAIEGRATTGKTLLLI